MAYDSGFSRRSGSERELQPVAITAVDPVSRMAVGVTRTRHNVNINCSYATGDTITVPAVGEQWYCERLDGEWRLYGRIPFNDPTLNIEPEQGQVSVGSAYGPLELNGTEVRANAPVLRLNGVYYRDSGTSLERSTDQVTWTAVAGGVSGVVEIVANALTGYGGGVQADAVQSLKDWSAVIQGMLDSFWTMWTQACDNAFIDGLKRLGVGDSDVQRVIDGFQNFANYLFGTLFCDFTGDVTPQAILARLRDLLAPIVSNPFILGLQQVAVALGTSVGNLVNDAINGLTGFITTVYEVLTCQFDAAALATLVSGIAAGSDPMGILAKLSELLGVPDGVDGLLNNPIIKAIQALATELEYTTTNLLDLLVNVTGDLVNWFLKVLRTVFPFDELWETLLPFIDWDAVDAVELPDLTPLGLLTNLNPLLKIVFGSLETFLGLAADGVSNFFKNILTFFSGTLSSFFTLVFQDQQAAINYFLTDVIKIATMVDDVLEFIIGGATDWADFIAANLEELTNWIWDNIFGGFDPATLFTNLTTLFGFDIRSAAATLATLGTSLIERSGIIGALTGGSVATLAALQTVFIRLWNLFGTNWINNFAAGTFSFAAAGQNFITNVLSQAGSLSLGGFLQTLENTGYGLAEAVGRAVLNAIRSFPIGGQFVAAQLEAWLKTVVNLTKGTANSGANLLIDPKVDYPNLWYDAYTNTVVQTGLTVNTNATYSRSSAGNSLAIASSGSNEIAFTINDRAAVDPLKTTLSSTFYVECWVLGAGATFTLRGKHVTLPSTSGTAITGITGTGNVLSATGSGAWTKLSGYFKMPTSGTSDGFVAGVLVTGTGTFYVDDMVVQDVTGSYNTNNALLGTPAPTGTNDVVKDSANPVVQKFTEGYKATTGRTYTSSDVQTAADSIRSASAALAAQVASLTTSDGGAAYSGNSASVSFDAATVTSMATAGFTPQLIAGNAALTVSGGAAVFSGTANPATIRAVYTAKQATKEYQKVGIVFAGQDGGKSYIYARMNLAGTNYVYASFYDKTIEVGYNIGGGDQMVNYKTYTGLFANAYWVGVPYWLECGYSGSPGTYRLMAGDTAVLSGTDIPTRLNSNTYTGFGGTGLGSNNLPGSVAAFAFYDNMPPNTYGSGFRVARTTAATGNSAGAGASLFPATSAAVASAIMPNTVFEASKSTTSYNTSEYTWDNTTNGLRINVSGWYHVCVNARQWSATGSGIYFEVGIRKGASVGAVTNPIAMGAEGMAGSYTASCSTIVYCAKNEVLYPAYRNTYTGSIPITGDTSGIYTYFSVAFLNNTTPVQPT